MDVYKISQRLGIISLLMLISVIAIPILSYLASSNYSNYTPKNYIGVVIDGDNKRFKRLYIEDKPTINTESARYNVIDYVNKIMNYNSTNYVDIIRENKDLFDKKYYKSFARTLYQKINTDIDNGYHIVASIVSEKPVMIGMAYDGKNIYYRYSLKTSTIYRSEIRDRKTQHNVIVVVKVENPKDNINGMSIANIIIM